MGSGAVGDFGSGAVSCGQQDSQGQIQLDYEVVGTGTVRQPGSGKYEQFAKWGRRWIVLYRVRRSIVDCFLRTRRRRCWGL